MGIQYGANQKLVEMVTTVQPRLIGLLASDEACLQQYERDLIAFGFEVRPCANTGELCKAAAHEPLIAVTVVAPLLNVHLAIAQLRMTLAGVDIIAVTEFPDRQSRIGTLLSGATACVDKGPDALEVAAVLLALHRHGENIRQTPPLRTRAIPTLISSPERGGLDEVAVAYMYAGEPTASTAAKWRLLDQGWTLISPKDEALTLTASERQLMLALMTSPERIVTRDGPLFITARDDIARQGSARDKRTLDVMVSRLRQKAARQNMTLPIRSVRGKGYCFAGEC
ncbi:winged helix-turn-helix domain-containing protein [Bordetella bronchialis]|uniref:winged helix-turn-helix domain-containing protein n=1 Tax=Bordetella bronchialis TaxID=463025 RepID=UPI003CFC44A7